VALALAALRGTRPWREATSGALLGLLLFFKPHTVLVVLLLPLLWVAYRRWARLLRHAAGTALGAALAVGVSWLHFGSLRPWVDRSAAMGRIEAEGNLSSQSCNFSLARALTERGIPDPSLALTAALSVAAVAALWLGARRAVAASDGPEAAPPQPGSDLFTAEVTTAAIGLGIPLLGFHLAWMRYFVLALPLLACALRPVPLAAAKSRARTMRGLQGIAGTLLLFGGPLYLSRSSGPPPPALQYSIGTAILLLVALTDLAGGSPGARHTSPPG
jgi:4-amino-4-deoxy-L-arabinose transferase-like glycosyltransferase